METSHVDSIYDEKSERTRYNNLEIHQGYLLRDETERSAFSVTEAKVYSTLKNVSRVQTTVCSELQNDADGRQNNRCV